MAEPEEIFERVAGSCLGSARTARLAWQARARDRRRNAGAARRGALRRQPLVGRMGVALAEEAQRRGADVTLLACEPRGARRPAGVEIVEAPTAADAPAGDRRSRADADVVLMAAAVSDYRPAQTDDGEAPEGRRAVD